MKDRTGELLYQYLIENKIVTESEFQVLKENTKSETLKEIITVILDTIKEKVDNVDTSTADVSRGDVKQLRELDSLQNAITKLENLIDRSKQSVTPELQNYLKEIIKSIMYLNQYSAQFKDAYKDRKVLLILKYQSLILSVFSAVSYLISVMIDFGSGNVELITKPKYEEIAPIKTLIDFNNSVENGTFKIMLRDVTIMREHFVEVPHNGQVLESAEIITMVMDGLQALTSASNINTKLLVDWLYKAAGIVALIMSLREVFYMFFRTKSKVSDVVSLVDNFANASGLGAGVVSKLNTFIDKYQVDAEESTKLAQRDIESENRDLSGLVKKLGRAPDAADEAPIQSPDEVVDLGF
jgi:hypothetical protein